MGIRLDSILLFALVIPFIMSVRISPGVTPYWLFGMIFLGLLIYILLDIIKINKEKYYQWKQVLLWFLVGIVIGSSFVSAMIVRHRTHPTYQIHDMPLQQEIAIRYLLDGKNPYAQNYFGTFLEQWRYSDKEVNPALYHFVLPPFYILFALPFYFMGNHIFGFFDARMPLLFLFLILLVVATKVVKDREKRLLFLIILAFNPAMLIYTLEGRSDVFMFSFLLAGLYLLHKERYSLAGIPLALAFAVKQSAWLLLPFYIAFLYFKKRDLVQSIKLATPFMATFTVIALPFLIWNSKAFIDSIVFYLSGSVAHSYPISGYGFGMVLREIGVIGDIHQYYPFHIWQIIIGLPLLVILIQFLRKAPSVSRLILAYGIFIFVFWYFSRYLNNSHLGYLSMVFTTAYFWPKDKNNK